MHPAPHRLVGDVEPALGQQILDVAVAQGEAEIEPDRVLDDLGRKAMAAIGERSHLDILTGMPLSGVRFRDNAGGRTFGVVTRLTLKTHEMADRAGAAIFSVKAMSGPAFRELIRKFVSFYAERLCNPHWGESVYFQRNDTLLVAMVSYGLDKAAAQSAWQPFLDWIAATPGLPTDRQTTDRRHASAQGVGRRSHAVKKGQRYRYYVSAGLITEAGTDPRKAGGSPPGRSRRP